MKFFLFGFITSFFCIYLTPSSLASYFVQNGNEVGYIKNQLYTTIPGFDPTGKYFIQYMRDSVTGKEYIGYSNTNTPYHRFKTYELYSITDNTIHVIYSGTTYNTGLKGNGGFVYNDYFYGATQAPGNNNVSSLMKKNIYTGMQVELYNRLNVGVGSVMKSDKYERYFFTLGLGDSGLLREFDIVNEVITTQHSNLNHPLFGAVGIPNLDYAKIYTFFNNSYSYKYINLISGYAGTPLSSIPEDPDYSYLNANGYTYLSEYSDNNTVVISNPVGLTQSFQSPDPLNTGDIEEQPLLPGTSVGKFQSGSGIILRASTFDANPENLTFEVEVYQVPNITNPIVVESDNFNSTGSGKIVVGNLPAGEYYWKARVVDSSGNRSEQVDFEGSSFLEKDFSIFEGFEPYPNGYKFGNNNPIAGVLTGGIEIDKATGQRSKIEGTKWDIFHTTFPESSFSSEEQMFKSFESIGLEGVNPGIFADGSCFGMGLSAAAKFETPILFQSREPNFSSLLGSGSIWDKANLELDFTQDSDRGDWEDDSVVLPSILANQLYQYDRQYINAEKNSIENQTVFDIRDEIQENPDETYMLTFYGEDKIDCTLGFFCDKQQYGHAVVVYKAEDDKIYFWDNNVQYPEADGLSAYEQSISIQEDGSWDSSFYDFDEFTDIALINVKDLYEGRAGLPIGNGFGETLITVSGNVNILLTDINSGDISGFQNGNIIENIPDVDIVIPLSANLDENYQNKNTERQIIINGDKDLLIEITSNTSDEYDLKISNYNYYTKLEGVQTSSGQKDVFTSTATNLQIDFDDSKTGDYNILVDNFQDSETGTVYIDEVDVIPEPQQFTIDWTQVTQDTNEALTYEIDEDIDGTYDTIISVPAVITGEELIEEEPQESTYIYPDKTISWNSGQQRAISSYYSIVPNFDEYNWGEDIAFTTSGDGNPTVNTSNSGRQSSGVLRNGANIQMDVPSVGESYTAYLHIGQYIFEFTTIRDAAPEPDVGTLDFGTKTVNYSGVATSNWVSFPFLSEPTPYSVTGDGNPTAQNLQGQRTSTGTVRWGTNIKAEIPEPGETRVIEFEILGETGIFTIIRQ